MTAVIAQNLQLNSHNIAPWTVFGRIYTNRKLITWRRNSTLNLMQKTNNAQTTKPNLKWNSWVRWSIIFLNCIASYFLKQNQASFNHFLVCNRHSPISHSHKHKQLLVKSLENVILNQNKEKLFPHYGQVFAL